MIVLANSSKMGGRCVAGISVSDGSWIRPVSGREEGELRPGECAVRGQAPRCLDIVRFTYSEHLSDPAQPENVLIDGGDWGLVDRVEPADAYSHLYKHLEPGPELLGGIERGISNDVAEAGLDASLCLIEPDTIEFRTASPFNPGQARKARTEFQLAAQSWDMGLTDSVVAPKLRQAPLGDHSLSELGIPEPNHVLLTVSLTQPLGDTRWKLAAAVHLLP